MTEGEHWESDADQPQWIKRVRWSETGLDLLDGRLNVLASLWAEGAITTAEFAPEVVDAIQISTARPPATKDNVTVYAHNIQTAAGWMALLQVMNFCGKHGLRSPDQRVAALQLFQEELATTGPTIGVSNRSWIGAVCEFRSQTEDASDPMHQLVRRWTACSAPPEHEDIIEELVQLRSQFQEARVPDRDEPGQAIKHWIAALRADVQALVLRETDAYCQTNGLVTSRDRSNAWRRMVSAVQGTSTDRAP